MRGLADGSVAVHDQRAVVARIVKEALADPDEVGLGLVAQADTCTHAGMDVKRLTEQD